MDEQSREGLLAKLSAAWERQRRLEQQIHAHVDDIEHIRKALGNPYFFEPRPSDDPDSRAKYTGYDSHDPGLRLVRVWQDRQREIAELLIRLNAQHRS